MRNSHIDYAMKVVQAYQRKCKPLCRRFCMSQTSFDILMFLGNNPEYNTARDIVEVRGIRPNLVSINVDKLVREGYLRRESVDGDRRKTSLVLCEKAQNIVAEGRAVQSEFVARVVAGVTEQDLAAFRRTMEAISENAAEIIRGE